MPLRDAIRRFSLVYLFKCSLQTHFQELDRQMNLRAFESTLYLLERMRSQPMELHPLTIATKLCQHEVTDPRDKIYGISGLIGNATLVTERLLPNYQLSVASVYTEFARHCIEEGAVIRVLRLAGKAIPSHHDGDNEVFPSWVPDWREPVNIDMQTGVNVRKEARVQDSEVAIISMDTMSLVGRGRKVGEIEGILPVPATFTCAWSLDYARENEDPGFEAFLDFFYPPSNRASGQMRLRDFLRLVTRRLGWYSMDEYVEVYHVPQHIKASLLYIFRASLTGSGWSPSWRNHIMRCMSLDLLPEDATLDEVRELVATAMSPRLETFESVRWVLHMMLYGGTKVFWARSGKFGLGSPRVRNGDRIFCLAPSDNTFALRPRENEECSQKWLENAGECFVLDLDTEAGNGDSENVSIMTSMPLFCQLLAI